jgi:predicted nucleotidyltransferase
MINNELRETLQKVCAALNKHNVDFILVGGTAVGYYGYRRISGITSFRPDISIDLDFWYKPTLANYLNLVNALSELGIDVGSLDHVVFDPQKTFLKVPHPGFHTDFLPQMMGLDSFVECKKRATLEHHDGHKLYILSFEDLLLNKAAVGRQTDQDDIDNLNK